jgi:bacterial translation initiation factor 2 (bIF-2)
MAIRLSKVATTLNVGISSLVDFLEKKGIKVENNPNTKIDDEQYDLLIAEFVKDKKTKEEIERSREKLHHHENKETIAIEGYDLPKEETAAKKKSEKESIKTEIPEELKPHLNVIGNIDLNKNNKKVQEPSEEQIETKQEIIDEKEPAPEVLDIERPNIELPLEKTETEIENIPQGEDYNETGKDEIEIETSEDAPGQNEEKIEIESEPETEIDFSEKEKTEDGVFRIHKNLIEPNIVVKGTIDLDSINDKTRPPRKSKAQRKKERIEREQQKALDSKKLKEEQLKQTKKEAVEEKKPAIRKEEDDDKKKKRKRIRQGKVNIDRATSPETVRERSDRRRPLLKKPNKAEVSEEDVQKQIKETLARLTEKRSGKGGAKYRREKREALSQRHEEETLLQERESRILKLTEFVTANDLANMMNVPVTNIISTCMNLGVMVAINQRLDAETINIVADEYGFKTQFVSADVVEAISEEQDNPEDLVPRPPIVTVMGHVDHGKTSLLDNIRNTNVIAGEAGGITQHIGAYNVQLEDGRKITFLDTPGHEAFTAMRARGAKVTDIAIIIVAADDNVMPQTIEAINHASAAGVPIVFAINKIDKPGANPDKIKERLAEMNYLVEEWGGKYQSQDISSKKRHRCKRTLGKSIT